MVEAWYDPTNQVVSTDKNDPRFTSLGQLWRLVPEREWVDLDPERMRNTTLEFNRGALWAERYLKEKNLRMTDEELKEFWSWIKSKVKENT